MTLEIEIKLGIAPAMHAQFIQHPFLRTARVFPPEQLVSYYYDTADTALSKRGYSLRTRQYNNTWHQTVKTKAKNEQLSAELHQREEWESVIKNNTPDFSCLPQSILEAIGDLKDKIYSVFITRFTRHNWEVSEQDLIAIISLDAGQIETPAGAIAPISEVEIELKQGNPERILEIAEKLRTEQFPLPVLKKNKAKRGYALLKST